MNIFKKRIILWLLQIQCIGLYLYSQKPKQIEIISTNSLEFDKSTGTDAKKLIGNVQFQHENAVMYCDSAYFYTDQNIVDAFGNVSIHQGDTLHLYGKLFHYDGNTKMVQMRNNVQLIDKQSTLTTNYLDYNIDESVGYYINNGQIVNADNQLRSLEGYYFAKEKLFFFKGNVEIKNPKYLIKSDTLKYHTVSRIAYFLGPTEIFSQNNYIYCENGWYNTHLNTSKFYKNAYLTGEKRLLKGDSLFYDRNKGIGKAYHHIQLIDSTRRTILTGNYAYYIEKPEFALITDSAMLILYNNKDSMFLHADTLKLKTISDSTENKIILAYRKVKFFKPDLQGKSDSVVYLTSDSTLHMFNNPVLWSENNQFSANKIELHFANQQIQTMDFIENSFIIAIEDTNKFTQVKGKNMKGYFKNNDLFKLQVTGNAQTLYYAKDNNKIIGANRAVCSQINVMVINRKISRIVFLNQPDATFYPLNKLPNEEKFLKGFVWYEKERPLTVNDIFKY